ncbi:MAG: transporter [Burkholderiaceae bacterium]
MFRPLSDEKSRVAAGRVSTMQAVEESVCGVWTGYRSVTTDVECPCAARPGSAQEIEFATPAFSVSRFFNGHCSERRRRSMASALGIRVITMFSLGAACNAGVAGPPFLTDDPEPVGLHHVEINLIDQQTRAAARRAASVSGEVNVGCATATQCHVAVPIAFDHPAGGPSRAGLGDVEFGVKYRFLDRPDDGWSAAVYPTVYLPTGNASRGLGNGRAQILLPLWVQRSSGTWSWDAGIARLINRAPDVRDSWFTGLLAQRSFGNRLILGAELFRRTSTAIGEPSTAGFTIGAIVNVAQHQNLLISAGRGLVHVETNRCSMFLAYQLAL